jgi:hypothetical protein
MSQGSNKKIQRSRSRSQSRSPSRLVKPTPIKTKNQLIKIQKKENYNKTIEELIKQRKHLDKLKDKFSRTKPAHHLVFTKGEETRILTRKEVAAANAEYDKKLLSLKKLYLEGTKHTKEQPLPESFKSAYLPVKMGPVFVSFLSADANKRQPNFGQVPNGDGTSFLPKSSLLDSLPRAREGYVLKNSLTLLLYIYATVNDLKSKEKKEGQKNIPDDRMNYVFGQLPSLYYQNAGEDKVLMTKTNHKLPTYGVISHKNASFNAAKIENYYFQSIQSLNIYDPADLSQKDADALKGQKLRQDLLNEFRIIERANKLLKQSKQVVV